MYLWCVLTVSPRSLYSHCILAERPEFSLQSDCSVTVLPWYSHEQILRLFAEGASTLRFEPRMATDIRTPPGQALSLWKDEPLQSAPKDAG